MRNVNFALILIDSNGIEQAVTSSGDLVALNGNILFNSRDNAEKGLKKVLHRLRVEGMRRALYWYDAAHSNPERFSSQEDMERLIKQYKDYSLMEAGCIQIKEVLLQTQ